MEKNIIIPENVLRKNIANLPAHGDLTDIEEGNSVEPSTRTPVVPPGEGESVLTENMRNLRPIVNNVMPANNIVNLENNISRANSSTPSVHGDELSHTRLERTLLEVGSCSKLLLNSRFK